MDDGPAGAGLGPLFVDVAGLELSPEERERLAHPLVGGVILFSRNFEDPEQVGRLTRDIAGIRTPALLIAVDQEGGRVQRFGRPLTLLPPAGAYGELYDREPGAGVAASRQAGYVMALELRRVGVDFSFAPVLDLARSGSVVIGDRAFHSDPRVVTKLAGAFIQGMHLGGMGATGKHFPGHGGVVEDSHHCTPSDGRAWIEIRDHDLEPYRALCSQLHGVMTAHVRFPEVDPEVPTYSEHWLRTVLRRGIGFDGVVFSDDLSMAGARSAGDAPQRVHAALSSGCDMALICNDVDAVDLTLDRLDWRSTPAASSRLAALKGAAPEEREYRDALAAIESLRAEVA